MHLSSFLCGIISYFVIFYFYVSYLAQKQEVKFDETLWKEDANSHYKMIDNLLESDYLIGKSKDHITDVFGEPDNINAKEEVYVYELIGRSVFDFKITYLKLYFKNDIVYKFSNIAKLD